MTRTTAHLISHTHWDREWYMPYERHHVLLAKLMNELLDTLEKDERYRSFHLDGQTIIIEDYLQIHPEKKSSWSSSSAKAGLSSVPGMCSRMNS